MPPCCLIREETLHGLFPARVPATVRETKIMEVTLRCTSVFSRGEEVIASCGVPYDGLASHPEGVIILLVTSCCKKKGLGFFFFGILRL